MRNRSQSIILRQAQRAILGSMAAVAGLPVVASAQEAGVSGSGVEEIVVTATRREERLQDVGIAVTALGSEMLTNLNINVATDITRVVPSLKMNAYSSSQVVFNIRGVSQNDYGDQQEPPVAVYQDDSYSSSINLASFPIFDLARVEVLRGPQGTLFGRNATGGAIQFVSNRPTKDFGGYATATAGSYNQFIVEGAVSGPLTENLQARIAAISNTDDGYMESVVPGVSDRGGNDHYALRGQLAWQPSDTTDLNLLVRYMKADKETQAGIYSQEPACPNDQFQGEFTRPDQACGFWGTDPGEAGTGYRNDAITPSRGGDPWKTAETEPSDVDREITGATLHFDWDIGETLHLVSITDYQDASKFYREGGDASPEEGVVFYQGSDLEQYSQEFRLAGETGAHTWVAGLYGMRVDGDYTGKFATPFSFYDPTIVMSQKTTSWAVFAQDEWQFAEDWKLIVGARYWNDEREGSYFGTAPAVPGISPPVTIIFNRNEVFPGGSSINPGDAKNSFDGVTARVQLDWKPMDDLLLYASFNRGSKSGGFTFSTGTPYDTLDQQGSRDALEGIPFDEETLDAFELGAKSMLGDSTTLNVAAFYYDYADYQAFAQVGFVQTVINLDAELAGLEAELTSRPIDGLTLQLGASFLDSKVKDVPLPDVLYDPPGTIEDHDLPQAPEFSGNALARYEFGLLGGRLGIQGDLLYTTSFCFTVLCAPVEEEDSYVVTNARLSYDSDSGRWGVAAFVNNIFEEEYRVYAFDSSLFAGVVAGVYAKPRWYGLSATYRFGSN
jgi:iron complex outermembrane recepter protein